MIVNDESIRTKQNTLTLGLLPDADTTHISQKAFLPVKIRACGHGIFLVLLPFKTDTGSRPVYGVLGAEERPSIRSNSIQVSLGYHR